MADLPVDRIRELAQDGAKPYAIIETLKRENGLKVSRWDIEGFLEADKQQADRAAKARTDLPGLLEYIPQLSPKFVAPRHLGPLVPALEGISQKPARIVFHAPPRHAKTETVMHSVVYLLKKYPELVFGYSAYGQDLSSSKSKRMRELARRAGVRLAKDTQTVKEWRTVEGGGLLATSTGGALTGHGITGAMFIDDPVKNRVQAESKTLRDTIWDWFGDVVMTRIEPGASVFIVMTRWHPDDLAGRVLRERGKHKRHIDGTLLCIDPLNCKGCGPLPDDGFIEIRIPALDDDFNPAWPERWTREMLETRRREVGEFTWFSLYQGTPRGRGTCVFSNVYFYDWSTLPTAGFTIGIGVDLSYTEKTTADYAVAAVVMRCQDIFYVLEVVREQTTAPKFAEILRKLRKKWGGAKLFSIFYGPEKGSIDFMRTHCRLPIKGLQRKGDKFVRAQPTAAKWNDVKILLPQVVRTDEDGSLEDAVDLFPWVDKFTEVITSFTGVKDDCDDDVDALVAAIEGLSSGGAAQRKTAHAIAAKQGDQPTEVIPPDLDHQRPQAQPKRGRDLFGVNKDDGIYGGRDPYSRDDGAF